MINDPKRVYERTENNVGLDCCTCLVHIRFVQTEVTKQTISSKEGHDMQFTGSTLVTRKNHDMSNDPKRVYEKTENNIGLDARN